MGQAQQPAPAMSDAQFHIALIGVLGRIANALEAARPEEDQTISLTLGEFAGFDWAGIDAKVLAKDADGVSTVWHAGKVYRRRSNDKFGTEIWFSCGAGKNDDGTPKYRRLVEFKDFKPAEPLGRKTEQAMKAATQAPTTPPLPTSPLNAPPTTGVSSWDIALDTTELMAAIAEYQALGKPVPPQYQADAGDKPADVTRKVKSLRELIEVAKRPAQTEDERARFIELNRQYADLLSGCIFYKVQTPADSYLANNETAETIAAKIAILQPLLADARERDAQSATEARDAHATASAKAAAERPLAPERLKELIVRKADGKPHNARCSPQSRAAIAATLESILSDGYDRHSVQHFLSGRASIKDAPENVLLAIFDWLKPSYDADNKRFVSDPMAEREAHLVAQHVRQASGQRGSEPQTLPAGGK